MINENAIAFEKLLETNREELEAERCSMTEIAFAKLHKISVVRLLNYMGPVPHKVYQSRKVILDKEVVNAMRRGWMSDTKIAAEFHTSSGEVGKQCGSRKDNWIHPAWRNLNAWYANDWLIVRVLNTKSWEKQKVWDEYWRSEWNIVQQGERPIPTLKQFQKWW